MKITINDLMTTPAISTAAVCFGSVPSHMSPWAAPVQGIAVSTPAYGLGGAAGIVTTVAANAAKGADRKRAAGYEAFEDPL